MFWIRMTFIEDDPLLGPECSRWWHWQTTSNNMERSVVVAQQHSMHLVTKKFWVQIPRSDGILQLQMGLQVSDESLQCFFTTWHKWHQLNWDIQDRCCHLTSCLHQMQPNWFARITNVPIRMLTMFFCRTPGFYSLFLFSYLFMSSEVTLNVT